MSARGSRVKFILACACALASVSALAGEWGVTLPEPAPAPMAAPATPAVASETAPAQPAAAAPLAVPMAQTAVAPASKVVPEGEIPVSELPDALKDDAGESIGFALFRTFVVLGLVIMIAWLSLNFGLRRLIGLKGPLGGASVVTVLERIPLDQKRALFVVKAGGEYLLLGSGESALSLISKLNAEEVEKLMQRPQGAAVASPFLARLLSKRNP